MSFNAHIVIVCICRIHICLLWDRALIASVVMATLLSLARSYTQPFLLVMSNYWWKGRTLPMITKVFRDVQVVGCTSRYKYRGGKGSGDSLIIAIVGTPILGQLALLPPLDEACVSVFDVLRNRFDSHDKQLNEIERMSERCRLSRQRQIR